VSIDYRIDHARRLVVARLVGAVTDADLFGYQREVWSRPDVGGYDELIDLTATQEIVRPTQDQVRALASLSAGMDPSPSAGRLAIVAPQDLAFGLGRMYQAYRGMDPRSTKTVGVFRRREEAMAFLGLEGGLELGNGS
jgi:hypothetical protein